MFHLNSEKPEKFQFFARVWSGYQPECHSDIVLRFETGRKGMESISAVTAGHNLS